MMPQKNRLPSTQTISRVNILKNKHFKLIYQANNRKETRFRIIISKRTLKLAVRRNRLRRQISHLAIQVFPEGFDIIIIVYFPATQLDHADLEQMLAKLSTQMKP